MKEKRKFFISDHINIGWVVIWQKTIKGTNREEAWKRHSMERRLSKNCKDRLRMNRQGKLIPLIFTSDLYASKGADLGVSEAELEKYPDEVLGSAAEVLDRANGAQEKERETKEPKYFFERTFWLGRLLQPIK